MEAALDAASSSESSELKPSRGISEMMGRGTGRAVDSGPDVDFCFFFGCGSSVDEARCFERTGTGTVVRVVARGACGPEESVVACPSIGTGFRISFCEPGMWSPSA